MAATDASILPIRDNAYRYSFTIINAAGNPVSGATGIVSQVSKDGGTFQATTNTVAEVGQGFYFIDLDNAETSADTLALTVTTTSMGARTHMIVFYPLQDSDIPVNVVNWLNFKPVAPVTDGVPVVSIRGTVGTLDALLNEPLPEDYAAQSAEPSLLQILYMTYGLRSRLILEGDRLLVGALDGALAMVFELELDAQGNPKGIARQL